MITFNELLERTKTEKIAIHTPAEEQAITLLSELYKKGYTWSGGERLIDMTCYKDCREDTCYTFERRDRISFCSLNYFEEEGYTIIECGDINFKED